MGGKVKISMFVEVQVDEDELKELFEAKATDDEKEELDNNNGASVLYSCWYMGRIEPEIRYSLKDSEYLGKIINFVDFDGWQADEIDE